jgi:hypothetical protein
MKLTGRRINEQRVGESRRTNGKLQISDHRRRHDGRCRGARHTRNRQVGDDRHARRRAACAVRSSAAFEETLAGQTARVDLAQNRRGRRRPAPGYRGHGRRCGEKNRHRQPRTHLHLRKTVARHRRHAAAPAGRARRGDLFPHSRRLPESAPPRPARRHGRRHRRRIHRIGDRRRAGPERLPRHHDLPRPRHPISSAVITAKKA